MSQPTSRAVETAGPAAPRQSCQKTPRPGSWNAGGIVRTRGAQPTTSEGATCGQLERRRSSGVATVPMPCRSAYRFWAAKAPRDILGDTVGMQSHSVKVLHFSGTSRSGDLVGHRALPFPPDVEDGR